MVRQLGQPSLTVTVDRARIARYGLNVADVNGLIEASVGGTAATQVVQGERLFDLVVRLEPRFRQTPEAIGNILVATPGGQQVPLKELAEIRVVSGASFIYREDNSRYIGVQYSIENRDLASAVEDAQRQVAQAVKVPTGYRVVWGGEYEEYTASRKQLQIILPVTLLVIFVQTAVIYISYANELRRDGLGIADATREAAILRLRPIMMTALVAALGLLPAALSTGIGSDTQRPFALVIVGGLFSRLLISVFLMRALYAIVARPKDRLEV